MANSNFLVLLFFVHSATAGIMRVEAERCSKEPPLLFTGLTVEVRYAGVAKENGRRWTLTDTHVGNLEVPDREEEEWMISEPFSHPRRPAMLNDNESKGLLNKCIWVALINPKTFDVDFGFKCDSTFIFVNFATCSASRFFDLVKKNKKMGERIQWNHPKFAYLEKN